MYDVYGDFAEVYDLLMQDAPYEKWQSFLQQAIDRYAPQARVIADIGCGTGTLSLAMVDHGFQVYGVDIAEDMLVIAQGKVERPTPFLTFIQQDMRQLQLPSKVDVAYSFCDSLNYLLEPDDVQAAFSAIRSQVKDGGLFVCDMHTPYKLREKLGDQGFFDVRDDVTSVWQTSYDAERIMVEYDVTVFVEEDDGLYRKFQEEHHQRAYQQSDILRWLQEAGWSHVEICGDFEWDEPSQATERWFFVAR